MPEPHPNPYLLLARKAGAAGSIRVGLRLMAGNQADLTWHCHFD
ncbi:MULTISPECIES: hypothetical protein [unclassified Coleofasciculus]|nr:MULTISPECIES: hypothetical protein [unclassified Coleofasciculus]